MNNSNEIEQNQNWRWNLCFCALKVETSPDVSACRCRHLPNNAAILSPSTPRVISLTSSISPYQGSTLSPLTSNLWDPSLTLPGQDGIPVHDTLGNLINKRFLFFVVCCLFCLFFILSCLVYFLPPCFSSCLSNSPSFSLFWVFCVVCTVKWPYQVPRYVWDAAPHVPTFRFGKEMPSTNRLQGSSTSHAPPPPPARTVFPLAYSSANLCALAVFPLVFLFNCLFFSPHALIFLV